MGKKYKEEIKPIPQENPDLSVKMPPKVEVDRNQLSEGPIKIGLSGMKWELDSYFNQILGANSEAKSLDVSSSGISQTYHRIDSLEIVVTSPIQPSQDKDSKEFELVGSADLYPGFTPSEGDVFIGDHIDGGKYLLTVTSLQKLADTLSAAHSIDFKVVSLLDDVHVKSLESKTVRHSHWIKDRINKNLSPFLTQEKYGDYLVAADLLEDIPTSYIDEFFIGHYDYLQVPDLIPDVVDPGFTNFVLELFGTDHDYRFLKLKETPKRELESSILDILMDRNPTIKIAPKVSYKDVRQRHCEKDEDVRTRSLDNSNLQYCAMATITKMDEVNVTKLESDEELISLFFENLGSYDPKEVPDEQRVIPFNLDNDYYIFSKEFYTGDDLNNTFERVVRNVIKGKFPSTKLALAIYGTVSKMDNVSRYYYLPIVYLLLLASMEVENE